MPPHRSPRVRARLLAGAVAVGLTASFAVAQATAASAQEQGDEPPPLEQPAGEEPAPARPPGPVAPARAHAEAFRELATQVARNERQIAELTADVERLTARVAEVTLEINGTLWWLELAQAEIARLERLVRTRAAFIYMHAHAPDAAVVSVERVADINSGKKYVESAARTDGGAIAELTELSNALDARRRDLEALRAEKQTERDHLQRAKEDLEAVTAKQKKLLDEAGANPVMGSAELTAAQMAAWFESRGARYRLAGDTSITDLAQLYLEEGAAEHVRPEVAFVQAILETGSFGHATDNNFAGIGACDSCVGQIPFATPRDGVRGQIQMLRNYADPTSRAANLANPPSAPIYGSDPERSAVAYDTFFAKGRVPTWNLMGNGNWATDPGYAPKVLTLYFQLVSFATRNAP